MYNIYTYIYNTSILACPRNTMPVDKIQHDDHQTPCLSTKCRNVGATWSPNTVMFIAWCIVQVEV